MIEIDHDTTVLIAKSFGLFYLIAFSLGVLVYTFWPSHRDRFEQAGRSILDDEDGPCR
jgi:cytochrome c oxidase cbb3-type subunit IV